jgi:hypothetical protein
MNITVTAGPHAYKNCPLKTPIEVNDLGSGEASLVAADGSRIPCQLFTECGAPAVAWIEQELKPGETKTYRLETAPAGAKSQVEIEDIGGDKLEVRIGGKLFTRYQYGADSPRPFLHPFIGPKGIQVTRNFPMVQDDPEDDHDHPHHRSVWVAYGEVNGTDNWSEGKEHAYQRHLRFEEVTGGPVFGRIRAVNSWTSRDGAKQMEDIREFTFYNVEPERLVEVNVTFAATEGKVELTDTKEGGIISVRVAGTMDGTKAGTIVNAYGGKTEAETWGKPAQWVDYYGPVKGETMGITIMDHPLSFRYPTRWHVRNYGLFTANPFALKYYEPDRDWNGDHTMKKGEQLFFKYRLYVHEGDTQKGECGERYFSFIAPPSVEVA